MSAWGRLSGSAPWGGGSPAGPAAARLALLVLALPAAACRSVVAPPELAPQVARSRVYVVDVRTTHTGLALPDGSGGYVMWGFGDRRYMALGEDGVRRSAWLALPCVFTPGAVERWTLGSSTALGIRRETGARAVIPLAVDEGRAAALRDRLERAFAGAGTVSTVLAPEIAYAATGRRYNLWGLLGFENCNGAVAAWLRELDCDVPGAFPRWGPWKRKGSAALRPSSG